MARLAVLAFDSNGDPLGEYVFTSSAKSEQGMADWMNENKKPGIEMRFLGMHGVITPRKAG